MKNIINKPWINVANIISIVALSLTFLTGYTTVKTDIAVNKDAIEKDEQQNAERYQGLKEGQENIQNLLNQLLIEEKKK